MTPLDAEWAKRNAAEARQEAEALLGPGELLSGAGEVVRTDMSYSERPWIVNTLRHPNSISVGAAEERMISADMAGVLEGAVDAAESAGATNSLEKMFCHQLAAVHHAAMQLLARSCSNLQPVDKARMANAAARMIDVYQAGLLTLQKIKTGGKQIVVVQHVQVSEGGQAVIAGNMKTGNQGGEGQAGGGGI
jgi:hypothetical protein